MSLIVAPEAVAVVSPPVVAPPATPRPDTRPIEAADKANAGTSQQKQDTATRDPSAKAEPSARPPGTDPSLPPQTIFDASLIGEDYKPALHVNESGKAAPSDTDTESGEPDLASDTDDGGFASAASDGTQDGSHPFESRSVASYARVGSGSALNTPSAANPDWLTAIEKIA